MFIWLQNASWRHIIRAGEGLSFEEVDPAMLTHPAAVSAFDIMLMLREGAQGIVGTCVYKRHLFAAETVDRMLGRFEQVLEHMVLQPERPISAIPVSLSNKN